MGDSVFRKSSLEHMAGPERLNDYIKSVNPSKWLILIACLVLFISGTAWIIAGTEYNVVENTKGVVFFQDNVPVVFSYIPVGTSVNISEGMEVQVCPSYAPREDYGYIYGIITTVGTESISQQMINSKYGELRYVESILPTGNYVEVRVRLEEQGNNLKWSNPKGNTINIQSGDYCSLTIITRKPRII